MTALVSRSAVLVVPILRACNFDASATIDDGSCESLSCAGCTDNTACNYDDYCHHR